MLIGVDASRAFVSRSTGTENYSLHIIQALIQTKGEHRVRLYCRPTSEGTFPHLSAPDVETVTIACPRLWTHVGLARELWFRPPDVLFVPAHVLPLVCRVPAVVTVHDLGYLRYPLAHGRIERWYLDWTTRRNVRMARTVIADSLATRGDVLHFYGADPAKIRVIYPGIDQTLTHSPKPADAERVKKKYGIPGDYLLFLGSVRPRKNLARVMEGFAQSRQNCGFSATLVLAGQPGPYCAELTSLAARLGLSDAVVLTGYVQEGDKTAILSGATGLVFPSLYEGFGFPVLEAMACGVPVLTSNTSSLPEVAGDAAILVDPTDIQQITIGIERLMTDADLRHALVVAGHQRVRQFSWQSSAQQLWREFEAIYSLQEHDHGRR